MAYEKPPGSITEQYRARLNELLDRVRWYITGESPDGAKIIEAWDNGNPVYRFKGYYREYAGEWKLYTMQILKAGYEPLCRVRAVSIYHVRRLDVLIERGETP